MPNWCQNKLTIRETSPAFAEWLERNGFSFRSMVKPEDDTLTASTAAWGTKWDLEADEQKELASGLLLCDPIYFDTAWSPPNLALAALAAEFPEVSMRLDWYEGGGWYAGAVIYEGGLMFDHDAAGDEAVKKIGSEVFGEEYEDDDDQETTTTENDSDTEN